MKINGKKVVNAKSPLILEITKGNVTKGNVKDPASCAAARACIRQLKAKSARVHVSTTYVEFDNKWVRYRTPASLRTEIVSFDRGKSFEPGTYHVCPLQPSHQASGRRMGSPNRKAKSTPSKARAKPHHTTGIRASAHHNVWSTEKRPEGVA